MLRELFSSLVDLASVLLEVIENEPVAHGRLFFIITGNSDLSRCPEPAVPLITVPGPLASAGIIIIIRGHASPWPIRGPAVARDG